MEDSIANESFLNDSDDDIDFTAKKKPGKQALRIAESDSDEENHLPLVHPVETNETVGGSNSDESSNESKESGDDGETSSLLTKRKKKKRKKKSDEQEVYEHQSKINALCDDESSSDERQIETVNTKKEQRAPQRMSAKQAEEQMKIIQSESQRLVRECHLSVPYHKPKQHSLKDFLNRRTINRAVPMALTKKAAATIKMSREELEQYAKSLEDRNKESQEFYRSDSDDSSKDDKELTSMCDVREKLADETVAVSASNEEPTDVLASTEVMDIAEKSNEAITTDVELVEAIDADVMKAAGVVEYVEGAVTATDVSSADTEALNEMSAEVFNESNKTDALKETIEIDYAFGENDRRESKLLKDLPHYSTVKPCLKGSANGVINLDLDDDTPSRSGGDELLERFIKNVAKKTNRSAKEVSILSTDNGVIEMNNVKIESDEQNCIHSKPRKDYFTLKEELSLRIAAKRKEELKKKQMSAIEIIPMEDSDSEDDCETSKGKEIESVGDGNDGDNNEENYENDVEMDNENGNMSEVIDDDDEQNDVNESDNKNKEEDDDDDEVGETLEEGDNDSDGCELVTKTKQRKRIILMDNSDDDGEVSDGKLENSTKTVDLNSTSMSLEESHLLPEYSIDKTMSQISENQSRADQIIDSCSKIVPEQNETDNNMSTLFTQTADSISVSELLDLCSGSFVTQAENTNFVDTQTKPSFATPGNRFSDNDFSDDEIVLPKKLKKRKKVNISDDEDNDDNDDDEEDSNTIHSDESNADDNDHGNKSDADLSDVETVEKIVEYDSEENEIEVPVVQKRKIADFFENEAELSESEWGSADEDERNLDKFDIELGDEDEFDQNQLVSELDRIHRRRMLDQDAREVKIIKDTHFEDEEESGLGRQRQYKWKHMENSLNIDDRQRADVLNASENAKSDDENEETWRRMRHERNNILQESKQQNEGINDSKLSVVATKTKKRISIVKTAANLNTSATKDLSFLISRMKEEQTHRSSLLIRDEATLANLAKMTTDDDSIPSVNTNSKNFLFNVISSGDGKALGKRKLDDDDTADRESKTRKTTKKFKKSTLSVLDKLL